MENSLSGAQSSSKVKEKIKSFFPIETREKIRRFIFRDLRRVGFLDLLRPLGFLTCKNHIEVHGGNWESVLAHYDHIQAHTLTEKDRVKPAIYLEGNNLDSLNPFVIETSIVTLDISDSKFSFRKNHLIDPELNLITEFRSSDLNKVRPLQVFEKTLEEPQKLKGCIAYLSDSDPANYYHWMCRVLPLLTAYKRLTDLQNIDFFYVGEFSITRFHQESLLKVGIPMEKIIQTSCTADRLLMAIANRTTSVNDPIGQTSFHFSRNLFMEGLENSASGSKKRFYVERGDTTRRRVINEVEVVSLLNKYNFESIRMDGKTISQQAELFAQAEVVVAPHGAALTNLLFINPGSIVIELMPYGYSNNCFYTLASHANVDYFCLEGERNVHLPEIDSRFLDLQVDISKLEKICKLANL